MLRHAGERTLEIRQMHAVIHAALPHDVDRQQAILVGGAQQLQDGGLVRDAGHGVGVVARRDGQVGERAGADGLAGDGEGHGDVAHGEGEDGGVRDEDGAEHVGAVVEGGGEDGEGGDVEAGEFVEACGAEGSVRGAPGRFLCLCAGVRLDKGGCEGGGRLETYL